jgi:hypothetical protein
VKPKALHNGCAVEFRRADRDIQLIGYVFGAASHGDEAQNLSLSRGELTSGSLP